MVIISWIIGALLPIIALFMTSMVSNNIKLINTPQKEEIQENFNDRDKETVIPEKDEQINESLKQQDVEKHTNTVIYQPTKEKETIREIIKEVPINKQEQKNDEDSPFDRGPMSADTLSS
jgi:hypothetical protein